MKKLLKIFSVVFLLFVSIWVSNASSIYWEDNVLTNALSQRRATLLELVWWWKLENEIENLKIQLWKIKVGNELSQWTKDKLEKEVEQLEIELENLNKELIENITAEEFDELILKYNEEILLKKDLVDKLNEAIKENEINYEKIDLLIEKYVQEKEKMEEDNNIKLLWNIVIFTTVSCLVLVIYLTSTYFSKRKKLSTKRYVYINFFLAFAYIIFLISFFFYLYPQFSVFLIFMSWYMLVINSHLVGSFIWSLIVLQRFKIWEVVKFTNIYWRITNITPLYIILNPLSDDWVYINESVYIPHINILKESILKNNTPDLINHTFKVVIKEDSWVDLMRFLTDIETNILQKFLHNKLRSLSKMQDFYRISFDFTNVWHNIIIFYWKADAILNNKIERKIIWHLSKTISDIRREKENKKEEEKKEQHSLQEDILNVNETPPKEAEITN